MLQTFQANVRITGISKVEQSDAKQSTRHMQLLTLEVYKKIYLKISCVRKKELTLSRCDVISFPTIINTYSMYSVNSYCCTIYIYIKIDNSNRAESSGEIHIDFQQCSTK